MNGTDLSGFLRKEVVERFCRYVRINTESCEASKASPSTPSQLDLAKILMTELQVLGLSAVTLDEYGYVYATLPASHGITAAPLSLLAHMDTSPAESGENVSPVLHENYAGGLITFDDDPTLILSPEDSPELLQFKGETIIVIPEKV